VNSAVIEHRDAQRVDPGMIAVGRWRALARLLVLLIALPVAIATTPLQRLPIASAGWWGLAALIGACGVVWALYWPRAVYRRLTYRLDDTGIIIASGVLWRSEAMLPRVRIQHTDVTQGPLQRRYGIATLRLYTAGSRFTEISLPGLAHGDALALRDVLLAEIADDR
jgi:uncharacterized protein